MQVYEARTLAERHSDAFRACYMQRGAVLCSVLRVFDHIYFDPGPEELFIALDGKQVPGRKVLHVEGLLAKIRGTPTSLGRACLAARIYFYLTDQSRPGDTLFAV
jgi:hypothetical protein